MYNGRCVCIVSRLCMYQLGGVCMIRRLCMNSSEFGAHAYRTYIDSLYANTYVYIYTHAEHDTLQEQGQISASNHFTSPVHDADTVRT